MEDIKDGAVAEEQGGSQEQGSLESRVLEKVSQPSESQPEGSVEVAKADGKQAVSKPDPTAFDYDWWKKDKRYGRIWKTDRDVIKSAYEADQLIEKQYKPLRSQVEVFNNLFKEYGHEADPEKLKSVFEDYRSLKDPENPVIKRGNYFSYFYDNPEYKNDVENFFEGMRKKEIRKQFGDGVSDEIVNEIIANRKFREETEQREKARADEETHRQLVGTIEQGWQRVEKECKDLGFPVSDDIRKNLLDVCAKENVDPRFMFYRFMDLYKDEIGKYQKAKAQAETVRKRETNRRSGVIPASPTASKTVMPSSTAKQSMVDRVKDKLGFKT